MCSARVEEDDESKGAIGEDPGKKKTPKETWIKDLKVKIRVPRHASLSSKFVRERARDEKYREGKAGLDCRNQRDKPGIYSRLHSDQNFLPKSL